MSFIDSKISIQYCSSSCNTCSIASFLIALSSFGVISHHSSSFTTYHSNAEGFWNPVISSDTNIEHAFYKVNMVNLPNFEGYEMVYEYLTEEPPESEADKWVKAVIISRGGEPVFRWYRKEAVEYLSKVEEWKQ